MPTFTPMTSTSPAVKAWATHPMGKAARAAIAASGMVMSTLVLMTAAAVSSGTWALVALGLGLAATSVRAARVPSTGRLALATAVLLAIPLAIRVI